ETAASVASDISPIDDIRASREYRLAISPVVVRRALEQAARAETARR
ncbi:MAG: xanthine dehydrogenase family protein subunit M, partial [Deltaproteobacteria bacterium]|nr:xanthine dehydrogenase family protein subunit M [Deltaproteobacteria bacterium]